MAKGNPHPTGSKNSPVIGNNGMLTEPGDNARYLKHALAIYKLPPLNIADRDAVEQRIDWYFDHCFADDMKPTVSGLAGALGVDRRTLWKWVNGETRATTHSDLIKNAYKIMEELWEGYMQNGKINPVAGIFLAKNNYGYRDTVEIQASQNATVTDLDAEEVKKRYEELPED